MNAGAINHGWFIFPIFERIYLSQTIYATMIYTAEINVMPLKELLDPQGKAVEQGLHNLGYHTSHVRIGKHITLKIEADSKEAAIQQVEAACKKLLHNPVMEYYTYTVDE